MVILLLFLFSSFSVDAVQTGNGGSADTIFCKPHEANSFSGYYNLDYLATYRRANKNADVVGVANWESSAARVENNLRRLKAYKLLHSFLRFKRNILSQNDFSTGIVWREAGANKVKVSESELINKLPANCVENKSEGPSSIMQAIYWRDFSNLKVFYFDLDLLENIKKAGPLQISFLFVHKWLWTHIRTSEGVRIINRLIHSVKFDSISDVEFAQIIKSFNPVYPTFLQDGMYKSATSNNMISIGTEEYDHRVGNSFRFFYPKYPTLNVAYELDCVTNEPGETFCSTNYNDSYDKSTPPSAWRVRLIDFAHIGVRIYNEPEEVFAVDRD